MKPDNQKEKELLMNRSPRQGDRVRYIGTQLVKHLKDGDGQVHPLGTLHSFTNDGNAIFDGYNGEYIVNLFNLVLAPIA